MEKFPGLPQAEKATKSKVHSKARSASDVTLSLPAKPKVGLRSLLSVVGTVVVSNVFGALPSVTVIDTVAIGLVFTSAQLAFGAPQLSGSLRSVTVKVKLSGPL